MESEKRPDIIVSYQAFNSPCPGETIDRFIFFLNTPLAHRATMRSKLLKEVHRLGRESFIQAFDPDTASSLLTALVQSDPKLFLSLHVPYSIENDDSAWPKTNIKYMLEIPE